MATTAMTTVACRIRLFIDSVTCILWGIILRNTGE
jgi:hypothetical protein